MSSALFPQILNHSLRRQSVSKSSLEKSHTYRKSIRINPILNHRDTQGQLCPVQVGILDTCKFTLRRPIPLLDLEGDRGTYEQDGDLVEDIDDFAGRLALVVCLGRHCVRSTGGEVDGWQERGRVCCGVAESQPHPAFSDFGCLDEFLITLRT